MESVVQAVLRRARQEDGEAWLRDLLEPVEELSDFAEEMEEAVPASEVPLCAQSGDEEEPGPSDRSVSAPPPGRRASARKHQNTSQEGSAHKGGRRLQGANVGCRSAASQQGPAQGKRPCKKKGTSSPAEPVRKSLRSSAAARSRETQEQGVASALLQEDSVAFAGAEGARSQDRAAGAELGFVPEGGAGSSISGSPVPGPLMEHHLVLISEMVKNSVAPRTWAAYVASWKVGN
ncbi:uncharacterized protein [Hyperolius riggenbachi]|uniref:uncharacterized protein isoform X3 n=1 Tax=Hyperolius riggenbachi TaxID=752182 RepID=UPI0035A3B902